MTARLTSTFFVAAYLRRAGIEGVPTVLRRRGAEEAGAIFLKIDRLDGTADLFGPAPQSSLGDDAGERRFIRLTAEGLSALDVETALQRQIRFDSDLWAIESDDPQGRHFLNLADV